jgi:hypothetical protein
VTLSKISIACWTFFVIMSVAFLPAGAGLFHALHALPPTPRLVLVILVVGTLGWGPFGYAMYLSLAGMRNGDRRLLKRGSRGTAVVLSGKATRTVIQEGEFAWEAPRVWKYRLRVSIPGRAPYETDCSICIPSLSTGSVVNVAASRLNHRRVTIDVGQDRKGGARAARPVPAASPAATGVPATSVHFTSGPIPAGQAGEAQRINLLDQLGRLHSQGILTDSEFTAEKAQILGE